MTTGREMMEPPDGSIVLPKWFLWIAGVLVAAAMPWAYTLQTKLTDVNVSVAKMQVRLEGTVELRSRIGAMEKLLIEHQSDPAIHHAGIQSLARRVDQLEKRIERLEDKP